MICVVWFILLISLFLVRVFINVLLFLVVNLVVNVFDRFMRVLYLLLFLFFVYFVNMGYNIFYSVL